MARAIEINENGEAILTNAPAHGPLPGRLSLAALKPGDVLFWYTASRNRKISAIREFSRGPFSHVGIYTGNNRSVDAGPEGVKEESISISNESYVHVMRKIHMTPKRQAAVVAAAREFVGYRYAWLDMFMLPFRRRAYWRKWNPRRSKWDWVTERAWLALLGSYLTSLRLRHSPSRKIFCSQIIVEAYAAIGHFPPGLVEAGVFTPNDLAADTFFTYEGWLSTTNAPPWHPLDPYSPEPVGQRQWHFSLARIIRGTSTGSK
jgi:hypothetical protein